MKERDRESAAKMLRELRGRLARAGEIAGERGELFAKNNYVEGMLLPREQLVEIARASTYEHLVTEAARTLEVALDVYLDPPARSRARRSA